jgi:hypothetical protein
MRLDVTANRSHFTDPTCSAAREKQPIASRPAARRVGFRGRTGADELRLTEVAFDCSRAVARFMAVNLG